MDLQHHPARHSHCGCCRRELKMTTPPQTIMFFPVPSPIVSAVSFPTCFLLPTSEHLLSSISCPFDTHARALLCQTWRLALNWLDLMAEKTRAMLFPTWPRSSRTTDLIETLGAFRKASEYEVNSCGQELKELTTVTRYVNERLWGWWTSETPRSREGRLRMKSRRSEEGIDALPKRVRAASGSITWASGNTTWLLLTTHFTIILSPQTKPSPTSPHLRTTKNNQNNQDDCFCIWRRHSE